MQPHICCRQTADAVVCCGCCSPSKASNGCARQSAGSSHTRRREPDKMPSTAAPRDSHSQPMHHHKDLNISNHKLTNPSTKAAAAAAEAGSNTKQTNSSSSVHMAALTCACLPACLPPSLQLLRCLSSAQAALICNGETTRRLHPCAHLSRHLHSASARIQSSGTAGSLQAASARIRAGTLLQSDSSHYHHHLRALPSHVKQKSPPLPSCAQTASVPAAGCRHVQIMHLHRPSMIRCTAHHQQHFQAVLKQHPCCRLLPHTACISTALLPSGAQHTNRTSRLR